MSGPKTSPNILGVKTITLIARSTGYQKLFKLYNYNYFFNIKIIIMLLPSAKTQQLFTLKHYHKYFFCRKTFYVNSKYTYCVI
jgi:hypothetical protein